MGFLLAKILCLLVRAAACGALFSYWWFGRHYEDVTLEYTRSRDEWATWRRGFEARLAARPEVDLQPRREQVAAVDEAGPGIAVPLPAGVGPAPRQSPLARRAAGAPARAPPPRPHLPPVEHA